MSHSSATSLSDIWLADFCLNSFTISQKSLGLSDSKEAIFWSKNSLKVLFFVFTNYFLKAVFITKNVLRKMGSEGNFEVSFPKCSSSFLSLKQDLSNHLFFFFWEFLDFWCSLRNTKLQKVMIRRSPIHLDVLCAVRRIWVEPL